MGTVVMLCLIPSAVAVAIGALRARPRRLPAPYVQYRPERNPAVILAELEVRQTFRELAPLYDTPTLSGPPAR
ncbi:hypothetical protein [Streptomyces sp. NPDC056192]|uniref:hypothetical protein n=1 Tax=Streptomyces sp. NPDC056192 TaxID=3345743 RepID=UPI0035DAB801